MFSLKVNEKIELRLIEPQHSAELFQLLDVNREYLRAWHPWVDQIQSRSHLDRCIHTWLQQLSSNRGFHAGVWYKGRLCGSINHLNIDRTNQSTALSYWLDEFHQGRGIMTNACQALVSHAFTTLGLHRITIECATGNRRSRRIPERLGFKLEGTIRGIEWLHDHFADHAMYGLLKKDLKHPAQKTFATASVAAKPTHFALGKWTEQLLHTTKPAWN